MLIRLIFYTLALLRLLVPKLSKLMQKMMRLNL